MPFVNPSAGPTNSTPTFNIPTPPSQPPPQQAEASPIGDNEEKVVQGDSYDPEAPEDNEKAKTSLFSDAMAFLHEDGDVEAPLNKTKIIIFSAVGCIILLLVCVIISSVFEGGGNKGAVDVLSEAVPFQGENQAAAPAPTPAPPAFQYTEEQKKQLRAVGYTGSDIEKFEAQQIADINALVEEQKAEIRKAVREQYTYLQDQVIGSADEETAEIYANTWYGLNMQVLGAERVNEYGDKEGAARTACKENVDYIKIPLLGNQCWLKLELLDGTIAFFAVSPERYASLEKDSGNIVIQYNKVTWRDCVFIQDIKEVSVK